MNLKQIKDYEASFPENFVIDGVVDAEEYINSKFKIAWFFKGSIHKRAFRIF
jgi:hypothetical protein